MARLFGTDGVRGLANRDLTLEMSIQLAQAAAIVMGEEARSRGIKPKAVIGRDPRISGEFIAAAVAAGLSSSGVDVFDAGVLPTPATAFLTADLDADFGVMISASHNAAPDNGIKFFARGGHKLDDAIEDAIEAAMAGPKLAPVGAGVGHITRFADAEDRYIVHLLGSLPNRLDGLKVVVDCAHGAAAGVSPQVFKDAGAEVIVIGADPDGLNINDGYGSTHLSALQAAVLEHGADLGVAHDGDADRCLAVDANGAIVDGDQIMTILAIGFKNRGKLKEETIVATVMSNLGFFHAMKNADINVETTAVGDRYVLEKMLEKGYSLGGEQSGHLIMREFATTGDGILTALALAQEVVKSGQPLQDLASSMVRFPQVLVNVKNVAKERLADSAVITAAVSAAEAKLGEHGRVLLRASGTEPLVRVMVEAQSDNLASEIANDLAKVVQSELG